MKKTMQVNLDPHEIVSVMKEDVFRRMRVLTKLEEVLDDPYFEEMMKHATRQQQLPASKEVPQLTDSTLPRSKRWPKKPKTLDYTVRHETYQQMTQREGVLHVLLSAGKPLSTLEVATRLGEGGYKGTSTKNLYGSVSSCLQTLRVRKLVKSYQEGFGNKRLNYWTAAKGVKKPQKPKPKPSNGGYYSDKTQDVAIMHALGSAGIELTTEQVTSRLEIGGYPFQTDKHAQSICVAMCHLRKRGQLTARSASEQGKHVNFWSLTGQVTDAV